jgi:broad specificity phosphatase PhoE
MIGRRPNLLVSSDLGRTRTTCAAIGEGEPMTEWREFDLGEWDGMRPRDIRARYPEVENERFGSSDFQAVGGERFSDFIQRVRGAFDRLAGRIDDGEWAIAVTHGGVIQTIVGSLVGALDQSRMLVPSNTSITTVRIDADRIAVFSYNDDLHLDGDASRPGGTLLRLIRHGETEANIERRWRGRGESPLTATGRLQAAALADTGMKLDAVVASPSRRAQETANAIAAGNGVPIRTVDDLVELHFGEWEGLTGAEAQADDPEAFHRIFAEGRDEPRGRTGERFSEAGERFAAAAAGIVEEETGTIGVFTHGGVMRAYVAGILGIPFVGRDVLPIPRNTAHCEIIYGADGPRLSSYNVATHLGD